MNKRVCKFGKEKERDGTTDGKKRKQRNTNILKLSACKN